MGKATGFMELDRVERSYEPVEKIELNILENF